MRACLTVPLKGVPTPIRKLARVPAHKNRRRRNDSAYFKGGGYKRKRRHTQDTVVWPGQSTKKK